MDDSGIVDLFLARDETALALVREKYGARLRAVARNVLCDEGAAEECEADAYMEAWNRIPPHEPREYLFAFLARIVRARALNLVRAGSAAKRSTEFVSLTDELASMLASSRSTEGEAEAGALADAVSEYLAGVSKDKRRVFVRRYWYADSLSDIAARYGMSLSKVKSLLMRARRELGRHLKERGFM